MAIVWDSENAAHLLRRAGFAAEDKDLKKALKDGQAKTVARLLTADKSSDKFKKGNEPEGLHELQFWWLKRMADTSSPLIEKLTLFWHNHFATAIAKIGSIELMHQQNRTLRKFGSGKFRELVLEMSRDPAMIIWLDNRTNVKDNPNENYARELMELFTTGVYDKNGNPNYTEMDVVEGARAFTGWTIDGKYKYFFNADQHDYGSKTFRGQTGDFDGTDVIDQLVLDVVTARHISFKLWQFFAHDLAITDALFDELEQVYLQNDTDLRALLEHMFLHDRFYSDEAKGARIKSPAELIVNSLRLLGAKPNSSQAWHYYTLLNAMGQSLFDPPTVFGWKEGLSWVGANGLLQRLRCAEEITSGRTKDDLVKFKPSKLLGSEKTFKSYDAAQTVQAVLARLGLVLPQATVDALVAYMLADDQGDPVAEFKLNDDTIDTKVRGLCAVSMSLPEFQRH